MNLQPVAIEAVSIAKPLSWQIYDRDGYALFAFGEMVASRRQLESLAANRPASWARVARPQDHGRGRS